MTLQTQRLNLRALTKSELEAALESIEKFAILTGISVGDTIIDEHLLYAFGVRLKKVMENEANYLWNTIWTVALKEQNTMIGALMIKGVPDAKGDVIVGYGINSLYQQKGYASEAHHRKAWVSDGVIYDSIGYGITREDWETGLTTPVNWNDYKY